MVVMWLFCSIEMMVMWHFYEISHINVWTTVTSEHSSPRMGIYWVDLSFILSVSKKDSQLFWRTCWVFWGLVWYFESKYSHCSTQQMSICTNVRPFVRHTISSYTTLWNSTKLATLLPLIVKCARATLFFCTTVRASICLSHYLLPNHWAEFNQISYITSSYDKVVQEQHFSVRPPVCASVHLSSTLSPPKPLGGIQPNLLHPFPLW